MPKVCYYIWLMAKTGGGNQNPCIILVVEPIFGVFFPKKKPLNSYIFLLFKSLYKSDPDEIRTRDLLRDRQAF